MISLPAILSKEGMMCFTGGGGKTSVMLSLASRFSRSACVIVTTTAKMGIMEAAPDSVLLTKDFSSIHSDIFCDRIKQHLKTRGYVFLFREALNGKYIGITPKEAVCLHGMRMAPYMLVEADGSARMPLKGYAPHEPPLPASFDCQVIVVGADALNCSINKSTAARPDILLRFLEAEQDAELTPPLLLRLLTSSDMYLKNSPPQVRRVLCINKADLVRHDVLTPWVEYLRARLPQYSAVIVTERQDGEFTNLLP